MRLRFTKKRSINQGMSIKAWALGFSDNKFCLPLFGQKNHTIVGLQFFSQNAIKGKVKKGLMILSHSLLEVNNQYDLQV